MIGPTDKHKDDNPVGDCNEINLGPILDVEASFPDIWRYSTNDVVVYKDYNGPSIEGEWLPAIVCCRRRLLWNGKMYKGYDLLHKDGHVISLPDYILRSAPKEIKEWMIAKFK